MHPWRKVMADKLGSRGGKRTMAGWPRKDVLAHPTMGLQTLLDYQLAKQYRGLLGGKLDVDMLIKVVTKLPQN